MTFAALGSSRDRVLLAPPTPAVAEARAEGAGVNVAGAVATRVGSTGAAMLVRELDRGCRPVDPL